MKQCVTHVQEDASQHPRDCIDAGGDDDQLVLLEQQFIVLLLHRIQQRLRLQRGADRLPA